MASAWSNFLEEMREAGSRVYAVAGRVIDECGEIPADKALRRALAKAALPPWENREVSRMVFAFFRWLGWLDNAKPTPRNLIKATEMQRSFEENPNSLTDQELVEKAVPGWVHKFMRFDAKVLREFQHEPRMWLRTKKGMAETVAAELGDCVPHEELPDALCYHGEKDLYRTNSFREGLFEIQDVSSQYVGHFCDPKPGEVWWDACAGEGGKTLHLCDMMENKGLVWASDKAEWRLKILKQRAGRAGYFNYRLKEWKTLETLPTKTRFDGILVDAPCSGFGTWGRNPHARWTARPEDVAELAELQGKILAAAASLLKPGGRLVYSVCTLTASETAAVADLFSLTHPQFTPVEGLNSKEQQVTGRIELWPQQVHGNGMFVAGWKR